MEFRERSILDLLQRILHFQQEEYFTTLGMFIARTFEPSPQAMITHPIEFVAFSRYPQTWTVNGKPVKFVPDLGLYSSSDPLVASAHIDALDYAHIDLSIASWWGPDTNLDRARLTVLMDKTVEMNSTLKWTIYHEHKGGLQPSVEQIRRDLAYLRKWFAWHSTWANKDGRPIIFVYNGDGCDVVERWMDASNGEWYVVLKLFSKFRDCTRQPDSWVSADNVGIVLHIAGGYTSTHDIFDIIAPVWSEWWQSTGLQWLFIFHCAWLLACRSG